MVENIKKGVEATVYADITAIIKSSIHSLFFDDVSDDASISSL